MGKKLKIKKSTYKKKVEKCWNFVCNIIQKHWILSSIFLTASGWWFSMFLTYCGEITKMVTNIENKRHLTVGGWIATTVVLIITVLMVVIQKYNEKEPAKKMMEDCLNAESGYQLLDDILISMGKISYNKSNTQVKEIAKIREGKAETKDVFTNPCEQLKNILSNMTECLSKLLTENGHDVKENDLYVSLAYNFPLENPNSWHWSENKQEKGMPLHELLGSENTTFSKLLNSKEPYLFYNSKQKARSENSYIPDDYDQRKGGRIRGSIACYKINVTHNSKDYVKAILSISTYDKCFSRVDEKKENEKIEYNMYHHIVSNFDKQIRVELCNYYMQFLNSHKGCLQVNQ